jgi:outer membrane lipoprotein-sorting protein
MTHENPHDNPDDLLERSLHAMRSAPIPDGPSQELFADTRSALLRAEFQQQPQRPQTLLRRILTMKSTTRIAASLLLVSAVAVAIVLFAANSVTFAGVVDKVANAKALSFTATSTMPNVKQPIPMKFLMTGDGRCRIESAGSITIKNDKTGEILVLAPEHKIATVVNMGANKSYGMGADPFEAFKQLKGKDAANLGEKEIDGRKCKGFTANQSGTDFVIWADAKTGDPVRVEISAPTIDGGKTSMVMTDFVVNPTVDEKLFDTTIPQGYQRTEIPARLANALATGKGEDHLIGALRGYAQRKEGKFPKRLDDWGAFATLVKPRDDGKMDEKDLELMTHVGAIAPWAFQLPKDQWAYLGDGITLGEKDKIVFWYQDPDSKKYRAIYGDLTVQDIDPKDVPRKTEK